MITAATFVLLIGSVIAAILAGAGLGLVFERYWSK